VPPRKRATIAKVTGFVLFEASILTSPLVDADGELKLEVYRSWKGYLLTTPCLLALRGFICQ
jgi:hypothetical protein